MHMFKGEGLLTGDIGTHDRDESWDGMAAEMARLMGVGPQWSAGNGWGDQPPRPEDIGGKQQPIQGQEQEQEQVR